MLTNEQVTIQDFEVFMENLPESEETLGELFCEHFFIVDLVLSELDGEEAVDHIMIYHIENPDA